MGKSSDKYTKRRLRSSYLSTIVSISLVLYMLGMVGLIILHAQKLSNYVKENIGFSVVIKESVKEVDIIQIKKSMEASPYVKFSEYVDKADAAKILQEDIGEDFISFLGYNPLLSSIDVHLQADYANNDSIAWIKKELLQNPKIKEIFYQESLVQLVNENIKKIGAVLLLFGGLLLIIAITLINSSIRLAIYSKRFLIRSMQLVGASQRFIRRPFVQKGVAHGLYGSFIAIGLLLGTIHLAQQQMPELLQLQDVRLFASLFGMVILLGIFISWICTFFAVRKYLRIKPDALY